MPTVHSTGADIYYETHGRAEGAGAPVILIAGLGGVGKGWAPQIDRFASNRLVIVADHRGTGQSTKTLEGLTIAQHAADMAAVIRAVGKGPAHVVGSSTGGAIAQVLALDHADVVKSASIVSSWAGPDPFFKRQFQFRRQHLAEVGVARASETNALFLWDPLFQTKHPETVAAWVETAATAPFDLKIAQARIDMILAHDQRARLKDIRCRTLVLVGRSDFCTPEHLSREMAGLIPGAELAIMEGGHFIYAEQPEAFHRRIEAFIGE